MRIFSRPHSIQGTSNPSRRSHRTCGGLAVRWIAPLALICAALSPALGSDRDARARPPAQSIDHTVASGETLYSLARRYGTSVEVLMEVNGITDVRKVAAGSVLRVPIDSRTARRLEIDAFIERSESQLRSARFEAALESADAARALLDALPDSAYIKRRVRLEIVTATVQVALGDRDAAVSSLRRALQADPHLVLDPAAVSPKVLSAFQAAREPVPATP